MDTSDDEAWRAADSSTEWWPALPPRVSPGADDAGVDLTQTAPGGMARVRAAAPLLNARPVPRGTHHDVDDPIPVTATLRWATGDEQLDTVAVEWWGSGADAVVRVRIGDLRVMTGAVWVPAEDVRRHPSAPWRPAPKSRETQRLQGGIERSCHHDPRSGAVGSVNPNGRTVWYGPVGLQGCMYSARALSEGFASAGS